MINRKKKKKKSKDLGEAKRKVGIGN